MSKHLLYLHFLHSFLENLSKEHLVMRPLMQFMEESFLGVLTSLLKKFLHEKQTDVAP